MYFTFECVFKFFLSLLATNNLRHTMKCKTNNKYWSIHETVHLKINETLVQQSKGKLK